MVDRSTFKCKSNQMNHESFWLLLGVFRDTAVSDESMSGVLFTNLLSQWEKLRSQEQNFLQRHNMKIIQQQLQVRLFCYNQSAYFLFLTAFWSLVV